MHLDHEFVVEIAAYIETQFDNRYMSYNSCRLPDCCWYFLVRPGFTKPSSIKKAIYKAQKKEVMCCICLVALELALVVP